MREVNVDWVMEGVKNTVICYALIKFSSSTNASHVTLVRFAFAAYLYSVSAPIPF